ncbi:MAG: MFS transporter [Bdellovibrionales bacterium]|nr:MFS transporter [Bdellovibrionales bacterium]
MNNRLKSFFVTRSLSGIGDEMWLMALPIWLAAHGFSTMQMGAISSAAAAGNTIGFVVVPKLCRHFKTSLISVGADLVQVVLFAALVGLYFRGGLPSALGFWIVLGFVLSLSTAIWFAATETLLSLSTSEAGEAQELHRYNYLAANAGPMVGPGLGGILYQFGGLASVALANIGSFFGQILSLVSLSSEEEAPSKLENEKTQGFLAGVRDIARSKTYISLTVLPSIVKLTLLGALPFIPFVLAQSQNSPFLIGLVSSCYIVGSTIGAYFYRPTSKAKLGKAFTVDSVQTLLAGALIILTLHTGNAVILSLGMFWGGFSCARYTVAIRSLRQLIIQPSKMSSIVSAQGLLVRLATPLSGIILGYFLNERGVFMNISAVFVTLTTVAGTLAAIYLFKSYDAVVTNGVNNEAKDTGGRNLP